MPRAPGGVPTSPALRIRAALSLDEKILTGDRRRARPTPLILSSRSVPAADHSPTYGCQERCSGRGGDRPRARCAAARQYSDRKT